MEYAARDTKPPEILAAVSERREGPAFPFPLTLKNEQR
jgi:hypothetical protein